MIARLPALNGGSLAEEPMNAQDKRLPLTPTPEMIEAGAQRLVRWEDGCVWPDSWGALQVAAARNEAERVWRSMWGAADAVTQTAADLLAMLAAGGGAILSTDALTPDEIQDARARGLLYVDGSGLGFALVGNECGVRR